MQTRSRSAFLVLTVVFIVSFGPPTRVQAQGPGAPIELSSLWEMQLGPDYTTTSNPTERNQHPYVGIFYVPSQTTDTSGATIPGLVPLYRLLNSAGTDHMDSTTPGEGGYSTEGIIGYVWSNGSAKAGLSGITRYYDNQPGSANAGDHATVVDPSPIAHPQSFPYYALDVAPIGYGYARYPGTDISLASVSGGNVEVKSNMVTGCAVWEWWWAGIEFINDYDFGRQLEAAAYYTGSKTNALEESGDQYGAGDPNVLNVDTSHPSPCVSISTSGNVQSTAAIPLDWNPSSFGGGIDNPVIYPDMTIGKNLTLDWIGPDGTDRKWPLAQYETVITSPQTVSGNFVVEAPTGYLNSVFNYYYYYTASSRTFTYVPYTTVQAAGVSTGYDVPGLGSGVQAVILSSGSSPKSPAMGIFINSINAGFVFYDNSTGGCTSTPAAAATCQYSSNFTKWEVHYNAGISPSPWGFKSWIVTDTLQNVEADINQLNTWAASYPSQMTSH